ncbi:MAG TPA: hypothetical protein VK589_28255 [Chryseolinea sp.]|nr:hypothetical protein [Chryseolinea sp.]
MKIIRKILTGLLGLIILLTLVVVLFFRQEAYQIYKVVTFFEPTHISNNFRNVKSIFNTSTVPKPDVAYHFPLAAHPISLPETFSYGDSVIQTKNYLDYTLTDALLIVRHHTILHEYYE